jgi:hypothetical protein
MKVAFVNSILPTHQAQVTVQSRDLTPAAAQILLLFGNGHPAKIMKQACESNEDSVRKIVELGEKILNCI